MPELGADILKRIAGWRTDGAPVSSFYLNVDGRRYPRAQDYLGRGSELARRLGEEGAKLPRDAARSVACDAGRIDAFLQEEFERGSVRGLALFSCSRAALWEQVTITRPVIDRATVAEDAYLLPLKARLETFRSFCVALVGRARARLFLLRMGRIQELPGVAGDVPGRHGQGGEAQGRYQRHIDEHAEKHLRNVATALREMRERGRFDDLILAGPHEAVTELSKVMHDYLRRSVVATVSLPATASIDEVLHEALAVEERVEAEKEARILERLRAGERAGGHAVIGVAPTLDALAGERVDTLVVSFGASAPGTRCPSCGRLWAEGATCPVCGGPTEAVPDVVESAVAAALRGGSRVEAITLQDADGMVGALLRY